jgi:hypothetical protein
MAGVPLNATKFPGMARKHRVAIKGVPPGDTQRVIQLGISQFRLLTGCEQYELVLAFSADGDHHLLVSCPHAEHPEVDLFPGLAS